MSAITQTVTIECTDCGDKVDYLTALKEDQTLLGNSTLVADTLLMSFDATHICKEDK